MSPLLLVLSGIPAAFILEYWEYRERTTSRAKKGQSRHPGWVRIAIRVVLPLIGLLVIIQFFGYSLFPYPVPSGLRDTLQTVGFILFWFALILAMWARESIGIHWAHGADFQVIPGQDLVTDGPYAYVRHPIYVTFLLMFIGAELMVGSWLLLLAIPLATFMHWQSIKEEELLVEAFGNVYRDYQKDAGMFFPRLSKTKR
jgi:protein-S-isoprenylcysteine O-methyltransferase Ste14